MTFETAEQLTKSANVIPLTKTLLADLHTPVSAYLTAREAGTPSFLFESVEPNEKIGRYSFIGMSPRCMLKADRDQVELKEGNKSVKLDEDFFSALTRLSLQYHQAKVEGLSGFLGGFVGYIGYDCVRFIEKLPPFKGNGPGAPEAMMALFDTIIRFDHMSQLMTIVCHLIVDPAAPLKKQYEDTTRKLETLALRLRNTASPKNSFHCEWPQLLDAQGRKAFLASVDRAKRHITEGDIFQAVLSRRVEVPFSGDSFSVYRALRLINPSPYLFYVDFGETKLIGSSPEVLVRVLDGEITVMPIAGTRQRGITETEDLRLEDELMKDEKELAEHLMLVDLGRNDVGRVSELGSVGVPVFKRLERYSHVIHIVSEVRGKIRAGASSVDAFKACFPAGTVSGAPKVRAMEIINELEPFRRGIYGGAVGYVGFEGSLDMCIAIRTIVAHRDTLFIQSGAGIVADSIPEKEYDETVNKSQALLDAVSMAAKGLQI